MLELSFEKEVVKTLTTGSNQWVERKDLYGRTVPASITKWNSSARKKYFLCLNFTANQTSTDKETCAIKAEIRSTPLNKNT